jgi:hypothetical protein
MKRKVESLDIALSNADLWPMGYGRGPSRQVVVNGRSKGMIRQRDDIPPSLMVGCIVGRTLQVLLER